jgi:pyridoxamine 5'-phosphate oxidase
MADRFASIREEYENDGLRRGDLAADPFEQFELWMGAALEAQVPEPNAMVLATSDAAGRPSARTVLLKGSDRSGLVFFTNTASDKGRQLNANPRAALCFLWLPLHRQVRVEGHAEPVSDAEADAYFSSRPRGAQLASAASPQSAPVADRSVLETRLAAIETELGDAPVPRPAHWSGYRVVPDIYEFWQGREHRFHDRFRYTRSRGGWSIQRLAP